MNKKESEYVEALETKLALRFTPGPINPDIPAPTFSGFTKGFLFNSYNQKVSSACSSSTGHNANGDEKTTTQRPRALYSTRKLALQAMRFEMEVEFAKLLRLVDKQIEAAEGNVKGMKPPQDAQG